MPETTVIYYTHNRERPEFESRIQRTLRRNSAGYPIVSVSQKQIEFGDERICVGDVGHSARNAWRQLQIGCQAARTRYVCTAESDMIFPKEYFRFVPPRDDTFYTARPVYVLFAGARGAKVFGLKPRGTEGAMVANREYVIDQVENMLKTFDMWNPMEVSRDMDCFPYLFRKGPGMRRENFSVGIPIVTIKTDENMHRKTPHTLDENRRCLEGYGTPSRILRKYMCGR